VLYVHVLLIPPLCFREPRTCVSLEAGVGSEGLQVVTGSEIHICLGRGGWGMCVWHDSYRRARSVCMSAIYELMHVCCIYMSALHECR